MWYILKKDKLVLNVDSEESRDRLLKDHWELLSESQIVSLGMKGYENVVSPSNTVVQDDGTIIFIPPVVTVDMLFDNLRFQRNSLLQATDKYLIPDYPITDSQRQEVKVYREALRDMTSLSGAPWDGGGVDTPWPVKPTFIQ